MSAREKIDTSREKPPKRKVRIAIVGGGCAGLAAAWELTRPGVDRDEDFDITIYEKSWRLGGKGASGRDQDGRIHDHGIHIWLGFYENAFRMMRECYDEVAREKFGPKASADKVLPHGSFDEAFFVEPNVGVASADGCGSFKIWSGFLPPMEGLPGTPLDEKTNPFTLSAYLARCVGLSKALMHSVLARADEDVAPGSARPNARSTLDDALDLDFSFDPGRSPAVLVDRMAKLLRVGVLTTAAGVLQGATIVETFLRNRNPVPQFSQSVLRFLEALAAQTRKQLRDLVSIDEELRRKTEIIDLIMTIMVGLYRDRVLFDAKGLDAINHIDCKEWLLRNGAVKTSVESPFVTGLYDLAFCYRDGDRKRPALAAGQAIRGALRMFFSYRGSPFWRMRSGMGETVFSPLFRILKTRGVRFKFLHALENIDFAQEGRCDRVKALKFKRAITKAEFSEKPLDHFGCWRHEPPAISGQDDLTLKNGDKDGFDGVVMAMGVDDFKRVCDRDPAFLRRRPRFKKMFEQVKTIGTVGAQVWMTESLAGLGWRRPSMLVSAFDTPFETWADMTHTLAAERAWRKHAKESGIKVRQDDAVQSIAYFCGVLPESTIDEVKEKGEANRLAADLKARFTDELSELLRTRLKAIWPKEKAPMLRLATRDGQRGGTLGDQVVQVNFSGSERYTLALPGTLEFRISPLDDTVVNMTIAGDWTECGFNEGCIEAAVMSGMLAANAISGKPDLNDIIGYNHP